MAYDKDLQLNDGTAALATGAAVRFYNDYIENDVYVVANGNATTAGTISIETSDDEAFGTSTQIATITIAATGTVVNASTRLRSYDLKKYVRASAGTAAGTFTIDVSIGIPVVNDKL